MVNERDHHINRMKLETLIFQGKRRRKYWYVFKLLGAIVALSQLFYVCNEKEQAHSSIEIMLDSITSTLNQSVV